MLFVRIALENDADPNSTNNKGCTALHWAAREGHVEIVKLLLENNANPNIADINGTTALYLAAGWARVEIVRLLLEYGADVDVKDNKGRTPLYLAVGWQNVEIVKLLLVYGAIVVEDQDLENKLSTLLKQGITWTDELRLIEYLAIKNFLAQAKEAQLIDFEERLEILGQALQGKRLHLSPRLFLKNEDLLTELNSSGKCEVSIEISPAALKEFQSFVEQSIPHNEEHRELLGSLANKIGVCALSGEIASLQVLALMHLIAGAETVDESAAGGSDDHCEGVHASVETAGRGEEESKGSVGED